jgi:rhodanese-related sulfurtransferase
MQAILKKRPQKTTRHILTLFLIVFAACAGPEPVNDNPILVTSQDAREIMARADTIILDVRTESEFNEKHIEGAVLIPVNYIEALAPVLIPDKDSTLLVYCRAGSRSATAAAALAEMGYSRVYDAGGINNLR